MKARPSGNAPLIAAPHGAAAQSCSKSRSRAEWPPARALRAYHAARDLKPVDAPRFGARAAMLTTDEIGG